MKTILFAILAAGALARGCAKIIARNSDEVMVSTSKNSDQLITNSSKNLSKPISVTARNLAKIYVNEDGNTQNLENWNDDNFVNYFLIDLAKINKILRVDSLNLKSAEENSEQALIKDFYKERIIRNYKWINENSLGSIELKLKDSTNIDVENGARYFYRLHAVNNFLHFSELFKNVYSKTKNNLEFNLMYQKVYSIKHKKDVLKFILEDICFENFFPFHEDLAIKIIKLNESDYIFSSLNYQKDFGHENNSE